jgi:hypothetical protein
MKKIILSLFIFNILNIAPSYSVESYVSNDSYTICATDANGAILVNDEGNEDLSSFALATDPTNFNLIDRGNINGAEADMGASCDITPDNYKMTFFKTGFCAENPYRTPVDAASNTINADLSSCVNIFDNDAGKEVVIQPDAEVDLLEGELLLPLGNYPFQFAVLDNVVQIKHEQVFVAASGAGDFDILGYNPTNNDKSDTEHKGKICYTSTNDAGKQFVSVQSNELGVSGSTTLRGYTLPVRNTGVQPSALFRCRSSVGTGVDAPAYMANILNSFGSPMCTYSPGATCTRDTSEFRNAGNNAAGFSSIFPRISQAYYLLQSDNTIATTPENVRRILWIQHDPDNLISITENTVGLKLNFKTNNAMQMQIHQDGSNSFARDEELMANQIHGGTIIGQIQVKTRRSRGAWR